MIQPWKVTDQWLMKLADGTLSYPWTYTQVRQSMWDRGFYPLGQRTDGELELTYDTDYLASTGWYLLNATTPPVDDIVTEIDPVFNADTGQYDRAYFHRPYTEQELADLLYQAKTASLSQARNTFVSENLGGLPFTLHPQDGSAPSTIHVLSPMTDFVSHFREIAEKAAAGEITTDIKILVLEKGYITIPAAHAGAVAKQILDGRAAAEVPMSVYLEAALSSTLYKDVPVPPATFVPDPLPILDLTILNPST